MRAAVAIGLGVVLALAAAAYLVPSAPNPCFASQAVSSRPVVGFSPPTVGLTTITFLVTCASPALSIGSYGFTLRHDSATAPAAVTLTAGNQTIAVGNDTFYVAFSDATQDGSFDVGDAFRIGKADRGSMPGGAYDFYLVWGTVGPWYPAVAWTV